MATALGRATHTSGGQHSARLAGAGDSGSGLYARWLFQAIMRINLGVKARALGEETFDWISRWVPTPGTSWKGKVECFAGKTSRLTCTLLMHWEASYEHAWAVLTDLAPEEGEVTCGRGLKRATKREFWISQTDQAARSKR